jgi:hypothetical protein
MHVNVATYTERMENHAKSFQVHVVEYVWRMCCTCLQCHQPSRSRERDETTIFFDVHKTSMPKLVWKTSMDAPANTGSETNPLSPLTDTIVDIDVDHMWP